MIAGLTALVLLGAAAAADPGPKIAVAFASSAEDLPREAIRAAIATELGMTVIEDVHAADGVLVVSVEADGQLTVSFRPRGPITELVVRAPHDRIELARVLAANAGTLVRNEAVEVRREPPYPAPAEAIVAAADGPSLARPPSHFVLSAVVGVGYGWSRARVQGPAVQVLGFDPVWSGLSPAGILHVTPEIGYRGRERFIASLQLRLQFWGDRTDACCAVPPLAAALLGRLAVVRKLGPRFELMPSMAMGFGRVRHRIDFLDSGGGPLLLGPGATIYLDLAGPVAAVVAISSLIGFPDATVNVDFSTGLAWRL